MKNEIVDIAKVRETAELARIEANAKDNRDIKVVDLLKILIRDIEEGVVKPEAILCLVLEVGSDGLALSVVPYRANLTRERENSMLSIRQFHHMLSWIGGDDDE